MDCWMDFLYTPSIFEAEEQRGWSMLIWDQGTKIMRYVFFERYHWGSLACWTCGITLSSSLYLQLSQLKYNNLIHPVPFCLLPFFSLTSLIHHHLKTQDY
jgi:hypothetical protein